MINTSSTYNPFGLMRSADMTDEQIDELWVEIAIDDIDKITSEDAVILKGGKGSGKTHLLRHHAFPLQQIRWNRACVSVLDGIKKDGYIGIYTRCSGLNASRFQKKNQTDEVWLNIFEYVLELLLAHELIHIIRLIIDDELLDKYLSTQIFKLFDQADKTQFSSLMDIEEYIVHLRKRLDLAINNCAFNPDIFKSDDVKIRTTRGSLIFGIPEILKNETEIFKNISFIYFIDEYENFTEDQQCYVNTLIREKKPPVGLKIGVRKYGIKTLRTLSVDEDIIEGSEYQTLPLDQKLRENEEHYRNFSYGLLHNRLKLVSILTHIENLPNWAQSLFSQIDVRWDSQEINKLINRSKLNNAEKPYFANLKASLRARNTKLEDNQINKIIELLSNDKYPLLEKTNILQFVKSIHNKDDLHKVATNVKLDCEKFIEGSKIDTKTKSIWSHFQQDLVHQLLNDYGFSPLYAGIDNFIDMSEGMPRNLINILKQTYDWSLFKDESFRETKRFSVEVQTKGAKKASDWFFNDMRKAGKDGILVQAAISRLAEIFKINHYAEKPVECSLITFSVNLHEVSDEAKKIIKIAENRSLLIRIDSGHKDKNYGYVRTKYQLTNMLSPRWGLPISRRGTTEFPTADLNVIFDCKNNNEESFRELIDRWKLKTSISSKCKHSNVEQKPLF